MEDNKDSNEEIMLNSENNFKKFQASITKEKIYLLNQEIKKHDKKGFVSYFYFIQSMKKVFDNFNDNRNSISNTESISQDLSLNLNKNSSSILYEDIYNLFFKRFREVKCLIKNDKEVFYLTDFKNENYISIYKVLCALIIFLLAKFDVKLELLFKFSDIDDDGLINKSEIKNMISTVNHLFVEETNLKMNSSILLQSLTNIKVENILKELLEGKGDLNNKLIRNGNYIDYNTFYQSVIKIKNYKYKIIPCFVNFKECLFNKKKENIIKIKSKYKNDFINISSSFMAEQCKSINNNYKLRKKYAKMDLSDIIKPVEYEEKNNEKIFMKTNMNLKSLMKNYSTILENNNTSCYLNDNESEKFSSNNLRNTKFAFQANYFDIRNIEVEPGIIQIIPNEEKKEETNNNSTILNSKEFLTSRKDIKNTLKNNNNSSSIKKDSLKSNSKFSKKKLLPYNNNKALLRAKKNKINSLSNSLLSKSKINNKCNSSRISRPSYNLDLTKKKSKIKNLMNDIKNTKIKKINNNNNKYKTFEEIMKEIKSQEDVFNNESINFINIEMVKESDQSEFLMKKLKHSFLFKNEKPNRSSSFYGILYRKKGHLPEIFNYKKKF